MPPASSARRHPASARAQRHFEHDLGELLGAVAAAMRSGFAFDQAMAVALQGTSSILQKELRPILDDIAGGQSRSVAFTQLLLRYPSPLVEFLVAGITISEQAQGNLAQVLDTIGETIRARARLRADLRVLTAQARTSATVVGVLPFILAAVLYFLAPDYFQPALHSTLGIEILLGGLGMSLIGLFLMRLVSRVKM